MEEQVRHAIGIDVGTENVRAVVLEIKREKVGVVGYGEARNNGGMRKGVVTNLQGPAEAVDNALKEAGNMCGVWAEAGYVSVNGSHLISTKTEGMVTIPAGQDVRMDDLRRLEDSAVTGRIPQNRDIIDVIPLNYTLDGQSGIRDPLGMNGVRLEMKANVISGLSPSLAALAKAMGQAEVETKRMVPTAQAAARAVLNEKQMENGVVLIDFGASTTSVAVYDEGDLQYVGVVNAGANNITKDLAISLEIDTEMAEAIKLKYVSADFPDTDREVTMKVGHTSVTFSMAAVNEVVRDRLVDIFEHVDKLLREAGYSQKLPEGAVIVGGGAKMRGVAGFAKTVLHMATKIGIPGKELGGVSESIEKTEYATAVGLALLMADDGLSVSRDGKDQKNRGGGWIKKLFFKN